MVESHIPTRWREWVEGPAESMCLSRSKCESATPTSLERRHHPSLPTNVTLYLKEDTGKVEVFGLF